MTTQAQLASAQVDESDATPRPLRLGYAWFVVGVLVLASIASYIDRQVVAIVVGPMKAYLHVSDSQIGWLYGIFAVFYAVAGVPIAWLADRRSRTTLIGVGILLWSFVTMACGLARTFGQVALARIGVGIGEAVLTPAANSLIGDLLPRNKIPFAVSLYMAGAVAGSGIAFIVGGAILSLVQTAGTVTLPIVGSVEPWQRLFLYCGCLGLVLVPLFLFFREPPRGNPGTVRSAATVADILQFYRSNRTTLILHHAGFLLLSLMGFGFAFWSVSYFTRVHGLQAASAAQSFGWIYLTCGSLANIWAPLLAERFSRAGQRDANIKAAMIGGGLAIPLIVVSQQMPTPFWAFVMYVPTMLCVPSPFGLAYGSLPVITPPAMRAVVTSVFMFVVNLGMLLGPPIAGFFNERLFPQPDGVRYSLSTLTLICGISGLVLLALCRKYYARSLQAADALENGRASGPGAETRP
jgi:MFS family permease